MEQKKLETTEKLMQVIVIYTYYIYIFTHIHIYTYTPVLFLCKFHFRAIVNQDFIVLVYESEELPVRKISHDTMA